MKNPLLISLFFILNLNNSHAAEMRNFPLDGEEVHLGYLPKKENESIYEEVRIIRNRETPNKVQLSYFFKFTETVCLERRSGHSETYPLVSNSISPNCHSISEGHSVYHHYYRDDYDDSYCAIWEEVSTSRARKIQLDFTNSNILKSREKETFKISILQNGERSTYMTFNGKKEFAKTPYRIEKIYPTQVIGARSAIGLRFIAIK